MWELNQSRIRLDPGCQHRMGPEGLQNRNFIAALKLGAAQAVFPYFERKRASLNLLKTQLRKETGHIREGENRVQAVLDGFLFQRLRNQASNAAALDARVYSQRSHLRPTWECNNAALRNQASVALRTQH
jgi:hypothetical protein